LNIPDSDQRLSLFFINTDGLLESWCSAVIRQLESAGLERGFGERYRDELSRLLKEKRKTLSIYDPVVKVNVEEFIKIVDGFIEKVVAGSYSS